MKMKTQNLTPAERQQNARISYYYKSLGVTLTKIETHPCVADLRTLMDFDPYHTWMSQKDKQIYAHAWQWVYNKELPLNTYIKRRLATIVDNIEYKQQRLKHIKDRQRSARNLRADSARKGEVKMESR